MLCVGSGDAGDLSFGHQTSGMWNWITPFFRIFINKLQLEIALCRFWRYFLRTLFFFFFFFVNELCNSVCIRTNSHSKMKYTVKIVTDVISSVEVVETWYVVILWDATRILPLRDVSYLPKKSERYEYPSFISSYHVQFHTTRNVELTTVRLKQFKPWKCRHVGT